MKALDQKRARLRAELEEAYSSWLAISGSYGTLDEPVDISGCRQSAKSKWFEYLAAKQRLVLAYAERPATTS
jgi:hypothetical protein